MFLQDLQGDPEKKLPIDDFDSPQVRLRKPSETFKDMFLNY